MLKTELSPSLAPSSGNDIAPPPLRDRLFWRVFSRLFVFTILYEDTEVEERHFGVNADSTVLSVAAAGCGIAGLLASHPRRIDAVDGNPQHLALTALKVAAAQHLVSHEDLYALFGRGVHADPKSVIAQVSHALPPWAQQFWQRHHGVFRAGLHRQGMAGRFFAMARLGLGVDKTWLRTRMVGRPVEERIHEVDRLYQTLRSRPFISLAIRSPLPLLAHGINYQQRDRNLASHGAKDMGEVLHALLRRIAQTDVEQNWILWNVLAGDFDHQNPDCRPRFLRETNHARSLSAPTHTEYHQANFLDVLKAASADTWSHYSFSDALDWMPEPVQRAVLLEVVRTSRPGAVLLNRTVDLDCMIARLGLERHFERMEDASDEATASECSQLYRRVDLYRVRP